MNISEIIGSLMSPSTGLGSFIDNLLAGNRNSSSYLADPLGLGLAQQQMLGLSQQITPSWFNSPYGNSLAFNPFGNAGMINPLLLSAGLASPLSQLMGNNWMYPYGLPLGLLADSPLAQNPAATDQFSPLVNQTRAQIESTIRTAYPYFRQDTPTSMIYSIGQNGTGAGVRVVYENGVAKTVTPSFA